MASSVEKIAEDGFSLVDRNHKLKNLAMLSLKIALQAYFSTYRSMGHFLHLFGSKKKQHTQATIDHNHTYEYCQYCAETIIHFQHFAELVCKDFLRAEHPLLAIDASRRPVILHKLLKKKAVSERDLEGVHTVEFSETLNRLCALIKDRKLGAGRLDFIVSARPFLSKLNVLRNREWHRGAFILRYPALDKLVAEHMLPFVVQVTSLKEYASLSYFWKYKKLSRGMDPIQEIIATCKRGRLNIGKVALLKELGRAAYDNPLHNNPITEYFDKKHKKRAKHLADLEMQAGGADVKECPVCGVESLVVFDDVEYDDPDEESGRWNRAVRYTYEVKCMCCTFEIDNHLKNPKKYGLALDDYWQAKEL